MPNCTASHCRRLLMSVSVDTAGPKWPRGLRRRSVAAHLLRSWVRIPPGAWIFVCCECCVLSGRGLCDELITRPEESYRLWCVVVCDLEKLKNEEAMTRVGSQRHRKRKLIQRQRNKTKRDMRSDPDLLCLNRRFGTDRMSGHVGKQLRTCTA